MTSAAAPYLDAFRVTAGEPAWLSERRRRAIDRFVASGFPSIREEAWRLTDLRALTAQPFLPATLSDDAEAASLAPRLRRTGTTTIVLVNGGFRADLSDTLPQGVSVLSQNPEAVQSLAESARALPTLGEAFYRDGIALALRSGTVLEQPLHLIHLNHAAERRSYHTRNVVDLGSAAQATVIETFAGVEGAAYWFNQTTRIALGADAKLSHLRVVADPVQAIHSADISVELADRARYDAVVLTIGALLSRQDFTVDIIGEHAFCGLNGGTLLRGRQHATLATTIRHNAVGAETREMVKSVADDHAHAVFQGKIRVERAGQKTNANQMSRSLLLSSNARIDTKPELEIFADDVRCSHGATVGDLNIDQLFYLEARGVPKHEARAMLIDAFVCEVLEVITDSDLRAMMQGWIETWLADKGVAS